MKALKNKTLKAIQALNDIRESQSTRLFFESLDVENQRNLFRAMDELKTFFDNLPEKK